jgi:hypothetical protein
MTIRRPVGVTSWISHYLLLDKPETYCLNGVEGRAVSAGWGLGPAHGLYGDVRVRTIERL